jgi:hypothetical protein
MSLNQPVQAIKKNLFMLLHFGLDNSKIFIITYLVLIFYATKNDILESIFRIEANLICVPILALTYFNFDPHVLPLSLWYSIVPSRITPFSLVFYCAITYYPFSLVFHCAITYYPFLYGIPLCHHVLPLSFCASISALVYLTFLSVLSFRPWRITNFFLCFPFSHTRFTMN